MLSTIPSPNIRPTFNRIKLSPLNDLPRRNDPAHRMTRWQHNPSMVHISLQPIRCNRPSNQLPATSRASLRPIRNYPRITPLAHPFHTPQLTSRPRNPATPTSGVPDIPIFDPDFRTWDPTSRGKDQNSNFPSR